MIIDAHAHFEPRLMDLSTLVLEMERSKIDKMVLVPRLSDPPETGKPESLMAIQRFMFYHSLLRPLAVKITESMYRKDGEWDLKWVRMLSGKKEDRKFQIIQNPENHLISEVLQLYPDRFLGWIFINPKQKHSLSEIEKWRGTPGMIGVKLHPFWHRFPLSQISDVAKYAAAHGFPINVHLGFGSAGQYRWLLESFPKLKIVFGHLGVPYYKTLWSHIRQAKNVFIDTASTYHVGPRLLRKAVKELGADRVLFASDSPYSKSESLQTIRAWIEALPLSEGDREKIFSKNFERLVAK